MPFNHLRSVENPLGPGQSLDLATIQELLGHRDVSTTMVADSLGTGLDG